MKTKIFVKTKIFALVGIVALMSSLLLIASTGPVSIEAQSVESLTMFQATKFDGHYRVPNTAEIELLLHEKGILLDNASPSQVEIAVQAFMKEWLKRNPTTPSPGKLRKLLAAGAPARTEKLGRRARQRAKGTSGESDQGTGRARGISRDGHL